MIEVVTGPMFSGKSTELVRRLRRAEIAGLNTILIRPQIDTTGLTHDGYKMPCYYFNDSLDVFEESKGKAVIGIDEVQFFDNDIVGYIKELSAQGSTVIVTGLDTTYRWEPFGVVPELLAYADKIDKLTAVCVQCGQEATRTQRLVNGKPAKASDPTILVGEDDFYEARCAKCWQLG